jgi:hypothetical protein
MKSDLQRINNVLSLIDFSWSGASKGIDDKTFYAEQLKK